MLQRMMLGWLKSLSIILCNWRLFSELLPRSRFSSITSTPRLSQMSSSAGEAGLWLQRMALQPSSNIFFTR